MRTLALVLRRWVRVSPVLLIAVVLGSLWASPAFADPEAYRNCATTEPTWDNNTAHVILCEDFEVNGVATVNGHGKYYAEDCDTATANGGRNTRTKGWCGTIFNNPITPDGAEICGGAGAAGTPCAGHRGTNHANSNNMADHDLSGGQIYDHVFIRWYMYFSPGYFWNAEKILTVNQGAGSGGIKFGNFQLACGGSGSSPMNLQWVPQGGGFPGCLTVTTINDGVWTYFEAEILLSTNPTSNDGYLKVWVNNCGTTGVCTGTPTLRLNQLNMSYNRNSPTDVIGALWFEAWTFGIGTTGTSRLDQIVVTDGTTGPIGFMAAAANSLAGMSGGIRASGGLRIQ